MTGDDGGGWAPDEDYRVNLYDFGITIPSTIEGNATLKVVNVGPSAHELDLFKLNSGKTVDDLMNCMMTNSRDMPAVEGGGQTATSPGVTVWLRVHLMPGNYVATCFIPDRNGNPHAMDSMAKTFKVVR